MVHPAHTNLPSKKNTAFRLQLKIVLLTAIFFPFFSNNVKAQSCCLTDSLVISTAYNQTTGTLVTPSPGARDPLWYVFFLSLDDAAEPGATTGFSFDIDAFGGMSGCGPNGWISFIDTCCDATASDGIYIMQAQRDFTLCQPANVTFHMSIAADDFVSMCTINSVPLDFPAIPEPAVGGRGVVSFTQTVACPAGHNYLRIDQNNYPYATGGVRSNGSGLDVCGYITTTTPVIVKQNAECFAGDVWPGCPYCTDTITGPHSLCATAEDSILLIAAPPGGTWTSSDTAIAIVGLTTGVVKGVSSGSVTITYTDPCNQIKTFAITLNPVPKVSLTFGTPICNGEPFTLTATSISGSPAPTTYLFTGPAGSGISGGSSTTAPTNYVTPIAEAGIYSVIASASDGCTFDTDIDITPYVVPQPIRGVDAICLGATDTLTDITAGGTWTSGNTAIATIGLSTGIITGLSLGTTTITYTTAGGCSATVVVTVTPLPGAITGSDAVCVNATITLSDSPAGGTWSSSNTSIATVTAGPSGGGIVTGVSAGIDTIIYTTSCGTVRKTITVNPLPDSITGDTFICYTYSATLADATAGGEWSSSNTHIATINSTTGFYTGVGVGTATISYTLISTGCAQTTIVTVNPLPSIITVSSESRFDYILCVGSNGFITDSITTGTWSSSNTAVATITGSGGSGIITGVSAGTAIMTYTLPTGCYVTSTIVTVNPLPALITGIVPLCPGTTTTLSDATTGGVWSTFSSHVTIDSTTGVITGISTGTALVTYSLGTTGCAINAVVTVNPLPGPFTASGSICVGAATTLSDTSGGGTWSSANTGIATVVTTTGVITGVSPGIDSITFTLPTGCTFTGAITVYPLPLPITGIDTVCPGALITLSDATTGGAWSSSSTVIARTYSSGIVEGEGAGTAIITYTLPTGCTAEMTVTVESMPTVVTATGTDSICIDESTTLYDADTPGVWSSPSGLVTVTNVFGAGVVTAGASPGDATINFTVSNNCGSVTLSTIVYIIPPVPPIYGSTGVCSGYNDTLSTTVAGGVWSSSNPSIATVDSNGIVTGITSGTDTITYSGNSACGAYTSTKVIIVNGALFISTNFSVACETLSSSLSDGGMGHAIITPGESCTILCNNSVVRYYANGNGGAYTWVVTGGTIVANYGDSIDVTWPTPGVLGSIYLYDTIGHCTAETNICIQVIRHPHADFVPSTTYACLGDNIVFTDLSTADPLSPIVSTTWFFGDGSASSETDPSHIYTDAGSYLVMLVVRNACNCTDTASMYIVVDKNPGPNIICPSIACQGDTVTYSTTASCSDFNWTVTGGTIVSGAGTAAIVVVWDSVGADGYGTVSLANPCSVCSNPTTVKIPVILQHPAIYGPDTVCTGVQYQYSFPLWPATQYLWDVAGTPSPIVGYNDNNSLVVVFNQAGYATIQGWYQNTLKLCGADISKEITVWPSISIVGTTAMCDSSTFTYTLSDIYITSANWILTNIYTSAVVATGTGTSFTYSFNTPGVYVLDAMGAFCTDPVAITVQAYPPPLDSVIGPDTVCMNVPYTYIAYTHVGGFTYNWQATGGTVIPASGNDSVTVVWTNDSAMQLTASLANVSAPYCPGPQTVMNIVKENPNANITGNLTPCENGLQNYACVYLRGDVYTWQILPNTAGSIVRGANTPYVTVQWNNYTGPAVINLIVQKCDTSVTGNTAITLISPPAVTLTATTVTACPATPITFTASSGGSSYTWNWGDGSGFGMTSGHTAVHSFPANTTSGDRTYNVIVSVDSYGGACPIWGTASVIETVLPGPVVYISTANNTTLCPEDNALLVGTATDNVGPLTYVWTTTPTAPPGSTNSTYLFGYTSSVSHGTATLYVHAGDGCSAESNEITLTMVGSCGGSSHLISDSGISDTGVTHCTLPVSASYFCNSIVLNAPVASADTGGWIALTTPPAGPLTPNIPVVSAEYNVPGIYWFTYHGSYTTGIYSGTTGCWVDTTIEDTVGIVPNFIWHIVCSGGGMDSVYLQDYSAYLPWWTIDSVVWDTNYVRIDTGINVGISLPATSAYTITETVYGTMPSGNFLCPVSYVVDLTPPNASFTDSLSPICEGLPITFTPADTAGIIGFKWNFGDLSSSLLPFTKRTYTNLLADSVTYFVTFTVTNSIGCVDSFTQSVEIMNNLLGGSIGSNQTVCSNDRPVVLSFLPGPSAFPIKYLWNTGDTTAVDSIYTSGYYYLKVTDAYQCVQTVPTYPRLPVKIKVIFTPNAQIYGSKNFCVSQGVSLSTSYDSTASYQWFRASGSDTTVVSTTNVMSDGHVTAGSSYTYFMVITVVDTATGISCSDTSAMDTVSVYASPPVPVINGPIIVSCSDYALQLTAVDSSAGYYNWSDGNYGPIDNIYSGGPYDVTFTDMNGCKSTSSSVYVPIAPTNYAQYFPSGCYTLCQQQLPLTLYGPPDVVFNYWAWLYNNDTASQGYATKMAPYSIDSAGSYEWDFNNGLCSITTDTMNISIGKCDACQQTGLTVKMLCTPEVSARYRISITFNSPGPCTYTLGTSMGPIDPFTGTLPASGYYTLTLSYTTMTLPPPDSVEVEIIFTLEDGTKCFAEVKVAVPPCDWPGLRQAAPGDTAEITGNGNKAQMGVSSAMLVFPNPTSGQVTISYNYGTWIDGGEYDIAVFDEMGRKVAATKPQEAQGNWSLNTNEWSPGIYIIRMDGNGMALQTQRLVVAGK